jgi:hypothetical protein
MIRHLHICPLQAEFKFYNCCPIHSCLYYSKKCFSCCIKLGTKESDNDSIGISNSELLFYKGSDEIRSSKHIADLKKGGILRIQQIYGFNAYLDFIRENYFDLRTHFTQKFSFGRKLRSKCISNTLALYPYNVDLFKITKADLVLILTNNVYSSFVSRKKLDSNILDYFLIIHLSKERVEKVRAVLKNYFRKKGITHDFSEESNKGIGLIES